MTKSRRLLVGAAVVSVMIVGGVVSASVMAASNTGGVRSFTSVFAAASPAATPKSNEAATHEKSETAAHEAAENSGTFGPGGPGPGHSNETSTHETGESATREGAENSGTAPTK
jgi:hypothetical protein